MPLGDWFSQAKRVMGATTRFVRRERPLSANVTPLTLMEEEGVTVAAHLGGTELVEQIGLHDTHKIIIPNIYLSESIAASDSTGTDNQVDENIAESAFAIAATESTILAHNRFVSESLTVGEATTSSNPELNVTEADDASQFEEYAFAWETADAPCYIPDHLFDGRIAGEATVGCIWSVEDLAKRSGNPNTVTSSKSGSGIKFQVTTAALQEFVYGTVFTGYFSAAPLLLTNHLSDLTFDIDPITATENRLRDSIVATPSSAATGVVQICFYNANFSQIDCVTKTHYEVSSQRWQSTLQASEVPSTAIWTRIKYYCEGNAFQKGICSCQLGEAHLTPTT